MDLKLPDNSFDYVMAFHVVSVVPDADATDARGAAGLQAGRPHRGDQPLSAARSALLAALDRSLEPITRRWGWHTLERADVFDGVALELERVYKTSRRSLFTIVVARNRKPDACRRVSAAT